MGFLRRGRTPGRVRRPSSTPEIHLRRGDPDDPPMPAPKGRAPGPCPAEVIPPAVSAALAAARSRCCRPRRANEAADHRRRPAAEDDRPADRPSGDPRQLSAARLARRPSSVRHRVSADERLACRGRSCGPRSPRCGGTATRTAGTEDVVGIVASVLDRENRSRLITRFTVAILRRARSPA